MKRREQSVIVGVNGRQLLLYMCQGISGAPVCLTTCKRLTNSLPKIRLMTHTRRAVLVYINTSSAPRAADAARYARARHGRMQLKTCKGGRKKRRTIWCEQWFDNAKSCLCRANCLVVLSCAVCFCYRRYVLICSTGVLCVGGKTEGRARSNTSCEIETKLTLDKEKRRKVVHNNTYYTRYWSMFNKKDTAQHDTAPQRKANGTAPHGFARRHAALLGCIKPDWSKLGVHCDPTA